jgi:hypothetical protein
MTSARTVADRSPGLVKGVERARREPEGRFNSLAHLIDIAALERAFHRQRPDTAVGVDGVTKEQYGQHLEGNLLDLHARLKGTRYRHQPIRRVHLPKGQGKTRPIGIAAFEDKIVQDAVREVLEAIYEQDFVDCSHGSGPHAVPTTPCALASGSSIGARCNGSTRRTSRPSWIIHLDASFKYSRHTRIGPTRAHFSCAPSMKNNLL